VIFWGVIQYIYEVEYNSSTSDKKVVLFYCDWFDPSRRGIKVDSKYGIVDIRMDKYMCHLIILLLHIMYGKCIMHHIHDCALTNVVGVLQLRRSLEVIYNTMMQNWKCHTNLMKFHLSMK